MNNKIPELFMELAIAENIPVEVAMMYYQAKIAKKSSDLPKFKLVELGICETDSEASRKLLSVWKNFHRITVMEADPLAASQKIVGTYQTYVEKAGKELEKIIGTVNVHKTVRSNDTKRVAIAGDFHFPFANKNALAALLEDPADVLFIVGDYFDMYAASKYRQTTDKIRVSEELSLGVAYMAKLSAKFSRIYLIKGNHDERPMRRLQDMFPQLLPLVVHPVDLLASQFDNVYVLSTTVKNTAPLIEGGEDVDLGFMAAYGDMLLGHFEGFCGPDAPRKVDGWISEWSHILPFEGPRVILNGHTHRLSSEYTSKGRLLIATGCMCNAMEYQFDGHNKYKPPTIGYVALYRDESTTELQSTQLIHLGVQ